MALTILTMHDIKDVSYYVVPEHWADWYEAYAQAPADAKPPMPEDLRQAHITESGWDPMAEGTGQAVEFLDSFNSAQIIAVEGPEGKNYISSLKDVQALGEPVTREFDGIWY